MQYDCIELDPIISAPVWIDLMILQQYYNCHTTCHTQLATISTYTQNAILTAIQLATNCCQSSAT
jgi:hypothetical protein